MLASTMAVVSVGTKVVLSHDVGGTFVLEVEAGCGSDACREWTPVFSRRRQTCRKSRGTG